MRALITGGAGFVGTVLARHLLAEGEVTELVLADLVPPRAEFDGDRRVRALTGELTGLLPRLGDVDVVFHLAGVVSGAAEADFDLGLRTNVDSTRALLEWCRFRPVPPILVFSSSLAVYGNDPALTPLAVVDDDTLPRPQTSYGIQKFIAEQLVADYTRKGYLRGRSVRLMTVAVRPGAPNAAASGFLSGIIREPLAGLRAVCPVPPDTEVALSSPRRAVAGLLRAAGADDATWGSRTALNLPALTTTPRAMAEALDRVTGQPTSALIDWRDDPTIATIVRGWPARFDTPRARALGLATDATFDDIIRGYLDDPH